jgi:hypothetical protein
MNIPASNNAVSLAVDGILPFFRYAPLEFWQRLQRNFRADHHCPAFLKYNSERLSAPRDFIEPLFKRVSLQFI